VKAFCSVKSAYAGVPPLAMKPFVPSKKNASQALPAEGEGLSGKRKLLVLNQTQVARSLFVRGPAFSQRDLFPPACSIAFTNVLVRMWHCSFSCEFRSRSISAPARRLRQKRSIKPKTAVLEFGVCWLNLGLTNKTAYLLTPKS